MKIYSPFRRRVGIFVPTFLVGAPKARLEAWPQARSCHSNAWGEGGACSHASRRAHRSQVYAGCACYGALLGMRVGVSCFVPGCMHSRFRRDDNSYGHGANSQIFSSIPPPRDKRMSIVALPGAEARLVLADHAERDHPIEQLASDIAG